MICIDRQTIDHAARAVARVLGLFVLLFPGLAAAGFYFELAAEDGGYTLASVTREYAFGGDFEDEINLGGGGKLALGYNYVLGENEDRSVSLSIGQMSDQIEASDGSADYDTATFDVIYRFHINPHRLGIGATHHSDPVYKEKRDGFRPLEVEFKDAPGLIIEYGYAFSPVFLLGLRYTFMDYELNDVEFDASSFGGFVALIAP